MQLAFKEIVNIMMTQNFESAVPSRRSYCSIVHSSLGMARMMDNTDHDGDHDAHDSHNHNDKSSSNHKLSCLWIWNSGEEQDMVPLSEEEDDDNYMDWENFREPPQQHQEDQEDDASSATEEICLNDSMKDGSFEIENMSSTLSARNSRSRMSASISSYDIMSKEGFRSVAAASVETLSYDDDIVATFDDDDDDEAEEIEIEKAVTQALSRAREVFNKRQASVQRRERVSMALLEHINLTEDYEQQKQQQQPQKQEDTERTREGYLQYLTTTATSMNPMTAHTTASMISSEYHSSELRSFGDQDLDDITTDDESDIFSQHHFRKQDDDDDDDLNSIVSSDFHSSDLESLDGAGGRYNVTKIYGGTDLVEKKAVNPKDMNGDECSSTEAGDDLSESRRSCITPCSFNNSTLLGSAPSLTAVNHVPSAFTTLAAANAGTTTTNMLLGDNEAVSIETELTGSVVSSSFDSDDDCWNENESSGSASNEFMLELRVPFKQTLSGLTMSLRPANSTRSLPAAPVKPAKRAKVAKESATTTIDLWKKVVTRPSPLQPLPHRKIHSAPPPSTRKRQSSSANKPPAPISVQKKKFVDTDLKQWSKVTAKPSRISVRKQVQEISEALRPLEKQVAEEKKKSKRKKKKKKKTKKKKKKAKKKQDEELVDILPPLPPLPIFPPAKSPKSTSGKSSTKNSSSLSSTSTAAKARNEANLDQLNSKMNSTIGVQMSPGTLAKKKTMSLSQRRESMKMLREKLKESFNDALSPIQTSNE